MNATFLRRAVLAGFFISGITGLVYQGIWIRMLTLVIGGTTAALTTVLIAFMGGLALGSFLFGGLSDRIKSPLKVYALIEGAIGAYAVLIPSVYQAVPPIYHALDAIDPAHGLTFDLLRFVLAVTFFGLPATLMGGTLPLIVKTLSRRSAALQVTVAEVYAVNTFGATLGAFLTGFVVIPRLGLYDTLYATAVVNVALAVGFWFVLAARDAADTEDRGAATPQERTTPSPLSSTPFRAETGEERPASPVRLPTAEREGGEVLKPRRRGLLMVFFLMGASSLSYEILWNRLLGLSFGSSVYAVSTMLTSFLLGIALGSWWLRSRTDRLPPTWATLGWLEVAITIAAPVTGWLLTLIPHLVQYFFMMPYIAVKIVGPGAADAGFWAMQLALFSTATLAMIVPTSLMGASFPLAVRLYADGDVGSSVGRVYAANTFGSILGLFFTGFLFVRTFGTQHTTLGWSVVNGLLGLGLLGFSLRRKDSATLRPRSVGLAAAVMALLFVGLPRWNLETLTAGVYYHALELSSPTLRGDIIFHTEDDMGLISIHRTQPWDQAGPARTMKINGKFMSGDGSRQPVHHMVAHLPILLRGDGAKTALVVGLGGGLTVEAALQHPLEQIDVAEISPGVIEGAKVFTPSIFQDKRMRVIQEDARSLLLTGNHKYDVIISETSDPWMTGVANLYTIECFRWIRQKLAPHGVFGTWLQTRHKTVRDVQIILKTMSEAFPHMAVFQLAEGDTMLIMSDDPITPDRGYLERRFAEMKPEMVSINQLTPFSLIGNLLLSDDALRTYLKDAAVNTDDLPVIEFSTPRSINIGLKGKEVWTDLMANAPAAPGLSMKDGRPVDLALWKAARAEKLGWFDKALEALDEAEKLGATPDGYLRARCLEGLGRFEESLALARTLPASPRQALLVAADLMMLKQYAALDTHLRDEAAWPKPANAWEERILFRRKALAVNLGEGKGEAL